MFSHSAFVCLAIFVVATAALCTTAVASVVTDVIMKRDRDTIVSSKGMKVKKKEEGEGGGTSII